MSKQGRTQISDLAFNPRNPRRITDQKKEMLKKSLSEYGDLSGIVFNIKTNRLMGGNQRGTVLPAHADIVIEQRYSVPTKTGTVAYGYVNLDGERFTYREVDWDDPREQAASIAANRGAGDWDFPVLIEQLNELDALNADLDLTMFDEEERDHLMGGWDDGQEIVQETEENLEGIIATIKVKCPQEVKDEVLIYLKAKILETSFEGVEIV